MKKIINLHIGKNTFLAEEDAYNELYTYLTDVRNHFKSEDGGGEIVADIESAIAEKYLEQDLGLSRALTRSDVVRTIEEMGTVEELVSGLDVDTDDRKHTKKLYRDSEDVILAGVSSGIAHYFNVDPLLVRLVFAVSVFFGGFGIFVYVILWLLVDVADTPSKKIKMEGSQPTVANIQNFLKEKLEEVPDNKIRRVGVSIGKMITVFFESSRKVFRKAGSLAVAGIGIGTVAIASVLLFAGMSILATFISYAGTLDPVLTSIRGVLLNDVSGMAALMGIALIFSIPLLLIFFLGVAIIKRERVLSWLNVGVLVVVWMCAVTILAGVMVAHRAEIHQGVSSARTEYIGERIERDYSQLVFNSVAITTQSRVTLRKGDTYSVVIEGAEDFLDTLSVDDVGGVLRISKYSRDHICFFFCEHASPVSITITAPRMETVALRGAVSGSMEGFESDVLNFNASGDIDFHIITNAKDTNVFLSGASKVVFGGGADTLALTAAGSTDIDASDFLVRKASIKSRGVMDAQLWVVEELSVDASGVTDIVYVADSDVTVTQDISGSARVERVGRGL